MKASFAVISRVVRPSVIATCLFIAAVILDVYVNVVYPEHQASYTGSLTPGAGRVMWEWDRFGTHQSDSVSAGSHVAQLTATPFEGGDVEVMLWATVPFCDVARDSLLRNGAVCEERSDEFGRFFHVGWPTETPLLLAFDSSSDKLTKVALRRATGAAGQIVERVSLDDDFPRHRTLEISACPLDADAKTVERETPSGSPFDCRSLSASIPAPKMALEVGNQVGTRVRIAQTIADQKVWEDFYPNQNDPPRRVKIQLTRVPHNDPADPLLPVASINFWYPNESPSRESNDIMKFKSIVTSIFEGTSGQVTLAGGAARVSVPSFEKLAINGKADKLVISSGGVQLDADSASEIVLAQAGFDPEARSLRLTIAGTWQDEKPKRLLDIITGILFGILGTMVTPSPVSSLKDRLSAKPSSGPLPSEAGG